MIKLITPPGMLLAVAMMTVYVAYAFSIGWIEKSWPLRAAGVVALFACYGTAMLRPWSRYLVYALTAGFIAKLTHSIFSAYFAGYFGFQFDSVANGLMSFLPSLLLALLSGVCALIVYRHFRAAQTNAPTLGIGQIGHRAEWKAAIFIFCAAFALRYGTAVLFPNIHHPDEIFQSLEQAYRAVFGFGIVPWEFRVGARSWLLPGLLAIPMWVGKLLSPESDAYRHLAQALIAALSSSTVVIAYFWGRQLGRTHAAVAAVIIGTWFELVYFGAKAFSEVIASCFLFAGVFACSDRQTPRPATRAFIAGILLGSAFIFRFHLAPALAVPAVWLCRTDVKARWLPLLAGAAIPLLILGSIDWVTWSIPFASVINNFVANIVDGRSHIYGTSPAGWYAWQFLRHWGGVFALVTVFSIWGARRQPLPLLVAIVIVLAHSAVAHKEYRFIFPAIPLILLSAAIGSADIANKLVSLSTNGSITQFKATLTICIGWIIASTALATSDVMRPEWSRGRGGLEFMSAARSSAHCGVGLTGTRWWWTGGYSSLNRNIPIHQLDPGTQAAWNTNSFDAWLAPAVWDGPSKSGFARLLCENQNAGGVDRVCYWTRRGPCEENRRTEVQNVIEAAGQ